MASRAIIHAKTNAHLFNDDTPTIRGDLPLGESFAQKLQEAQHVNVNQTAEITEIGKLHGRPRYFNAYGLLQKGPATTQAPNLPSITQCGDWSMGAVFDMYWKFLPEGDSQV